MHEWVEGQNSLSLPQPSDEGLRTTRSGTASPADQVLAPYHPAKPTTGPPAGPQQIAGEQVSWLQLYSHPLLSWNLLDSEIPPPNQQVHAWVMITWDPGGHPGSSRMFLPSTIPAPVPAMDAATDTFLAPSGDLANVVTFTPIPSTILKFACAQF